MSQPEDASAAHVGIFDSGVGGLSVLRAIRAALPGAALTYFADAAHASYGDRADAHALERSHRICAALIARGARAIVVACNTATAVAIDSVRQRWPEIPFVGVEPGIKPALRLSRSGRIGVMATPATLRSERYAQLLAVHAGAAFVHSEPCPGLAALIERGDLGAAALREAVIGHAAALRRARVDVVVLGCTHYEFARGLIAGALGTDITVLDTSEAVARQVVRVAGAGPAAVRRDGTLRLMASANPRELQAVTERWLGWRVDVELDAQV